MITNSDAQTFELGRSLAKGLKGTETIYLFGDVGAGKTVFTKGLAAGLGVKESVTSPTYTYFNIYESGRVPLYHFDLYRVKCAEDLEELGILEYLEAEGVKAVEWAELLGENARAIKVKIKNLGEKREITIENN